MVYDFCMMRRVTTIWALLLLAASFAGCGGDDTISSSEDLAAALSAAAPGARVCLGEGLFEGTFDIPAGVELCGAGAGLTRIVGPSDLPTLTVTPGVETPTRITGVTVESSSAFAVIAIGPGDVEIEQAEISVPVTGAGIGAERLSTLSLTGVDVSGPVTAANAADIAGEMDIALAPAYGIVAVSVMTVEATSVTVGGFGHFGMLSVSSNLTMRDSAVTSNLGTGLLVHGGTADLESVGIDTALQGTRLIPPYNVVFAGNADVATTALDVAASEGYGVLQSEATATHTDLLAHDNSEAAMWVQSSGGFVVTRGTIENNALAGIVALESSGINLDTVTIGGTTERTRIVATMPVDVGDGVQLLGSTTDIVFNGLSLADNARIGVLLDLDGGIFDGIDIRSADIDGSGTQLGAVSQNGTTPPGWDANITRSALIDANDTAFAGTLETVGIVGPSDLPAVDAVLMSGIAGIVGPSD